MPNGDGGGSGFDFGGIFSSLLGYLAAVIQAIINFLNQLVGALVNVLNFLYAGELGIFGFSKDGLTKIWTGLKNIMDQVFKVHVLAALHHLLSLYQKLQGWIRKLKAFLDRLRRIQQLYHAQAFKRVINLIQRIRKILVLFRIFHLKFATKLDNWLAQVEGKLISREAELARKTNEVIGWLNWILDPRALFKSVPLFGTARRSLTGILGAARALGMEKLFPQLVSHLGDATPTLRWSEWNDRFTTERGSNSGLYGEFNRSTLDLTARIRKELGA
jgi:hypothetical protein